MSDDPKKMYGFKIGETVETLFDLVDEKKTVIPAGSKIRLISFPPKVFVPPPPERRAQIQDGKEYFFNAVPDGTADWWENYHKKSDLPIGNRIRANFITIRKIKKKELV